jgi:DNA-binding NarL/FixJ family response regulator
VSATATASGADHAGRVRPLRVLLADAAPMQRAGLRAVLAASGAPDGTAGGRGTPGGHDSAGGQGSAGGHGSGAVAEIVVAGETGDGAEAVELARRLLPDVVIADLSLPRIDGLGVARAITAAGLPVRVLFLTSQDTDEDVLAAVAAGAAGFLRKDPSVEELVAAVRAVAAGGAVIAPVLLARILGRVAESLPAPETTTTSKLDALTDREREVLVHVARGHSNAEIAVALQVSETTIKTHVGHVLTKLRLRDRTQAVVLAYETGLVKPGA